MKECLTCLITYVDYISEFFMNNAMGISFDESLKDFDYNKYIFIIFSKKLDALISGEASNNEIYSLLTYINETKNDVSSKLYYYKYNDKTKKNDIKYTYKDFLIETHEFIKKNPKINFDVIPKGYFDGWSREDIDEFLNMYIDDSSKNFEVIDPEYIFLPSGTSDKKDETYETEIITKRNSRDNIELAIEKRKFHDKNRNMIHTMLLGKNRFKGYVANILKNGYVIFEKYDIKNECLSNEAGAAYIMNIDTFNELSKKNIQELRKIINEQSSDMSLYQKAAYVCHRGNWQDRLQVYYDSITGIKEEDINKVIINTADDNTKEENKIYYGHI